MLLLLHVARTTETGYCMLFVVLSRVCKLALVRILWPAEPNHATKIYLALPGAGDRGRRGGGVVSAETHVLGPLYVPISLVCTAIFLLAKNTLKWPKEHVCFFVERLARPVRVRHTRAGCRMPDAKYVCKHLCWPGSRSTRTTVKQLLAAKCRKWVVP